MMAPLRRKNKLIGAKWLRNGDEDSQTNIIAEESPQKQNPVISGLGVNLGTSISEEQVRGGNLDISNSNNLIRGDKGDVGGKNKVIIMESKKKKD